MAKKRGRKPTKKRGRKPQKNTRKKTVKRKSPKTKIIHVKSPDELKKYNEHIDNGKAFVVLYYMDGCPHCEHMKDDWDKFEKHVKRNGSNRLNVARVNARYLPYIHGHKSVYGFPTISVVRGHHKLGDYNGVERSSDHFKRFYEEVLRS